VLKTHSEKVISLSKAGGGTRILRVAEVCNRTGMSKPHIYALGAQGKFPKPIKLSARASGWIESEVEAFLAARIAASRGAA
jgi:prophage regulatory protein